MERTTCLLLITWIQSAHKVLRKHRMWQWCVHPVGSLNHWPSSYTECFHWIVLWSLFARSGAMWSVLLKSVHTSETGFWFSDLIMCASSEILIWSVSVFQGSCKDIDWTGMLICTQTGLPIYPSGTSPRLQSWKKGGRVCWLGPHGFEVTVQFDSQITHTAWMNHSESAMYI